jgi:spore photoproduct lyase
LLFRIGTGEITDSLALDPLIGFSREVIPFFAQQPNVLLELKTKSDCVNGLLDLDPKNRVVVSWSLNPQRVIDFHEHGTASLDQRLTAARRCQEAGYRLAFHFDPLIEYPGWEHEYEALLEDTFARVDTARIAWLSMGVLRTTPGLKRTVRARFPRTPLLSAEQVLCPDGKLRYFQPLRVQMYRKMLHWMRRGAPLARVYLCMETKEVWRQVFGFAPSCEKELGQQLTQTADG